MINFNATARHSVAFTDSTPAALNTRSPAQPFGIESVISGVDNQRSLRISDCATVTVSRCNLNLKYTDHDMSHEEIIGMGGAFGCGWHAAKRVEQTTLA